MGLQRLDKIEPVSLDGADVFDFRLPDRLVRELTEALGELGYIVRPYSGHIPTKAATSAGAPPMYAIFPSYYFHLAGRIYPFAIAVKRYFQALNDFEGDESSLVGSSSEILPVLTRTLPSDKYSDDDLRLLALFLGNDDAKYRLGGKQLLTDGSLRGFKDCFSSIILKYVNLSDASAAVFGRLVFDLTESPGSYSQLSEQVNVSDSKRTVDTTISTNRTDLSKPFVLLAGLSGTGKTRFVRQQAEAAGSLKETYCLVSVRPDWHDPSDLLGYLSRLGTNGPEYVVTPSLQFIVKAWLASVEQVSGDIVPKPPTEVPPYWLCLDEMNLAPVEQYFADYLSVMETRSWKNGEYSCDPILKPDLFNQLDSHGQTKLRSDLGMADAVYDAAWDDILSNGVQLPYNLIVAGTVNMDETTHGFSRKVIDRALTLDFGNFFPNDFDSYFTPTTKPVALTYPTLSNATNSDFTNVTADPNGSKTVAFLQAVNSVLSDTSFELAFRALNEILVSVVCHAPQTNEELQAVWDDFLMTKVLPRIEGDEDKLSKVGTNDSEQLLPALQSCLEAQLKEIWDAKRKDLLKVKADDSDHFVDCRTKSKLAWMQQRLELNGFTSFWP